MRLKYYHYDVAIISLLSTAGWTSLVCLALLLARQFVGGSVEGWLGCPRSRLGSARLGLAWPGLAVVREDRMQDAGCGQSNMRTNYRKEIE